MFYSNLFEIEYKKTFPFVKINRHNLFAIFFISMVIAICAFIMETFVDYINNYKLYDRGFLIGPFIPLYFFVVFFALCYIKTPMYSVNNFIKYILIIGISVSLVEYIVGNIFEHMFSVVLWNYEDTMPLSFRYFSVTVGFIWGILGSLLLFFVIPLLKKVADLLTVKAKITILTLFLVVFFSDLIVSLILIINNNFQYKEIYGPIQGNVDTTLFVISFIMYVFSASALALLINISKSEYKSSIYLLFYVSQILPLFSFVNFFISINSIVVDILSYIGYSIIYIYLLITLYITIYKLVEYKKSVRN